MEPRDVSITFFMDILDNLEGQLEYDNYTMDGVDVRILDNSNTVAKANNPIPYSLIGQYKLVIIWDDNHQINTTGYVENRNVVMADYLDVGGRLWVMGRRILTGSFGTTMGDNSFTSTDFLGQYMQLETGFATDRVQFVAFPWIGSTEFDGTFSSITGFPDLEVDTVRTAMINDPGSGSDPNLLMEVDWFTRTDEATTLYTYNSVTTDTTKYPPNIDDEDSYVASGATPTQCLLIPLNSGLLGVDSVYNATKDILAEVTYFNATEIMVSYPYSEPWSDDDILMVDYQYNPISDYHLKPVAIRYESQPRVLTTIEIQGNIVSYYTYTLGYRTSIFAFPPFYMKNDNGEVDEMIKEMLNWFFYPTMHWTL